MGGQRTQSQQRMHSRLQSMHISYLQVQHRQSGQAPAASCLNGGVSLSLLITCT